MTITYYYCQVCVRPLWLAPNLLFVLFCPVFALSMYICMLCVLICILVCLCVFLCVFPLEWNILCCIYAIYCTFYRTYVLVLQYLALYGIICLQFNSGYVKVALICPHTIPFWYFYPFLSYPVNPPQGSFFVCDTVWENSRHLTRREVRHPSVPLTPFSMSHGYPIPKMRILRQGGGGGRGAVGDEPTDRAPLYFHAPQSTANTRHRNYFHLRSQKTQFC